MLNLRSTASTSRYGKDAFAVMADRANPYYKIHILNVTLYAEETTLNPTVQMAHIKAFDKSMFKYLMRSVKCKVYSIPVGAWSHTRKNLFIGNILKRLVLENDAYNGLYAKNLFHAKNDINFLAAYVDG